MKIGFNRKQENYHTLLRCPTICQNIWCLNRSMFTTWLDWLRNIDKLPQTDANRYDFKHFGKDAQDFLWVITYIYIFFGQNLISSHALKIKLITSLLLRCHQNYQRHKGNGTGCCTTWTWISPTRIYNRESWWQHPIGKKDVIRKAQAAMINIKGKQINEWYSSIRTIIELANSVGYEDMALQTWIAACVAYSHGDKGFPKFWHHLQQLLQVSLLLHSHSVIFPSSSSIPTPINSLPTRVTFG